ncbi:uncharacterized protein [Diadema setosum]|uniref:uncharacterized protein n=1 Tax=Diadema setosum TaxID=31175 RepID=UPI003B3B6219
MAAEDDIDRFIEEQKQKIARERRDLQQSNINQASELVQNSVHGNRDLPLKENLRPHAAPDNTKPSRSDGAGLPLGNYIDVRTKLLKERQEEYNKFLDEKNKRSAMQRSNLEGEGKSLPIGERNSAKERARIQRNKEYNEFLKQREQGKRRGGEPNEAVRINSVSTHQTQPLPTSGYNQTNGPNSHQATNGSFEALKSHREVASQTPIPRGYEDLPPRGPRKGWGTPQPLDYEDILRQKREEEMRYRRYDDLDYYQPRSLKPAHSDPYLNRYDEDGRRSSRRDPYDDYDRRRVRFSDEVPTGGPQGGPRGGELSYRPRVRESLEEPLVYDWSQSKAGRSRTFTNDERPKPALKQEEPERPARAKSATHAEESSLPLGRRETESAARRKKQQYRKELEQQMQEAKEAKIREKESHRHPLVSAAKSPAPQPLSARQSGSQAVQPQREQGQIVTQPVPQGYMPSFLNQPYGTRAPPASTVPYQGQYGVPGAPYGFGSAQVSELPAPEPLGDLGLKEAMAKSQPELLDRPFSLNYPQVSSLSQPGVNSTDPYMYYGMRNPLEPEPNSTSSTARNWIDSMSKSLSNVGGSLKGQSADTFSVANRPDKLQGSYPVDMPIEQQDVARVHNPPFATYGAFGNPGSAGQRTSVKIANPGQTSQRSGQSNQKQTRFSENQSSVIPSPDFRAQQQQEMQTTFQRLVREYNVNPTAVAASFSSIPPVKQDNLLHFLQAYSSYLNQEASSNISEPLFGLQAFRDRVKADTLQDMASAYESMIHGLPHPTAATATTIVPPAPNLTSPLMERYLFLQQQQQQLLQQQQQMLPGAGQQGQTFTNPAITRQTAAHLRGESSIKNFVGDDQLSPRSQADPKSYRAQLLLQMKEKETTKLAAMSEKAKYEAQKEREMEVYDPWGKGGGGAPMRDKQGKIVADLKQLHNRNESLLADPSRQDLQLYAATKDAPSTNPAAAGQDVSPLLAAAAGGGGAVGAGPAYGKLKGPITTVAPNPSADASRNEYQEMLRQQVEEKKRREAEEKEKIRLEEEKEERRLAAQRERIKKEYEEELERKKKKEEQQRKQKEDLERQLEEKRKEAEQKKKEVNEKRRREADEKLRHRDLNYNVSNLNQQRAESPPIPTLREKNSTAEPQRTASPPIPTLQKKEDNSGRRSKQPRKTSKSPPIPTHQKQKEEEVSQSTDHKKDDGGKSKKSSRRESSKNPARKHRSRRKQSTAEDDIMSDLSFADTVDKSVSDKSVSDKSSTHKSGSDKARIFPPKDISKKHAELDPLDKLRNPPESPEASNHPRVIPEENARLSPMEKLRTHPLEAGKEQNKKGSFLDSGLFPESKGNFEVAFTKQRYLVDWLREIDPDLVIYAATLAENGYKTWNTIRRLKRSTLLELCPDIKHGHLEAILHEVNRAQTPAQRKVPRGKGQVMSPEISTDPELDIIDVESSKQRPKPAPRRRGDQAGRLRSVSPADGTGRYSESPPGDSFVDFLMDISKESEMYKKANRLQGRLQRHGNMQDDDYPTTSRGESPPLPAVSTKERGGPKDERHVMGALSAMRKQLASEQQRIQSQLDKHRDYDPYNPLPRAAHAPRRGSPQVDVFELARHKGNVAAIRNMTHQAAEDFDGLKNRRGTRARQQLKDAFPNKPDSDISLEAQQRALLRAQQEKLEEMRKGKPTTATAVPNMNTIGRGSPSIPLDSDSAFIGIDTGETHMPAPLRSRIAPSPVNAEDRKQPRSVSTLGNDDLDMIIAKSQARSDAIETLHSNDDGDADDILDQFLSKKSYDSRPPSGKSEDLSLWLKPSTDS